MSTSTAAELLLDRPTGRGRTSGQDRPPPAPVSGWRRMAADSVVVGFAGAVCHALGIVTSLVLRAALDPAHMGVWQALKLFLSYANYANLGISKGAARELSTATGRGDAAAAKRGLDLAFTVNTLSSLLYGALLAGLGAWLAFSSGQLWTNEWAVGLLVLAVLVVLQRHVTFRITILRCRQLFALTGRLSVFEALASLLITGCATWIFGLKGLYAGTLAVLVCSLMYLRRGNEESLAWGWDRREIGRLIGLGGPILLAGAAFTLFQSIDKLMILTCAKDRDVQLGCYSLALLVSGQLFGLANMMSLVMAPRYSELFGRVGRRCEVALLAARASELQAAGLALLGGLSLLACRPVLGRLLPAYDAGLLPALWLVPGAIAMGLSLPANQYLVAVYRERRVLLATLVATGLSAIGNFLALELGYGLTGVAIATSLGYFAYLVLMVAISFWPELDWRARGRYLLGVGVALAPALTVAAVLEISQALSPGDWAGMFAKGVAVVAAWTATVVGGWWLGGWSAVWRAERTR